MAKKIALLGSTGSIGRQSLETIREQHYQVTALAAGKNAELLCRQIAEFQPDTVAVADEAAVEAVRAFIGTLPHKPQLLAGRDAARQVAESCEADIVLNAIVGFAGLDATLAALNRGVDVALANKESLVAGGRLVMDACEKSGAKLLPVDSEHSAIFQCLQDPEAPKSLTKILLTASGGPFYGKSREELKNVRKEDALKHPNWAMGAKITIDSSTLMNKGLELIEAMWLFGLPAGAIEIVVQPQSIIHSMVEFCDHSVLAQLGVPDMRIPIQYALTWPRRHAGLAPALDFKALSGISFGQPDEETFRCLRACRKAAEKGGLAPCAANGANEEAVRLFLEDKITFLQIGALVEGCVDKDSYAGEYTLEDVYQCDAMARRYVLEHASSI